MEKITFALPKGRLFDQTIEILKKTGLLKEDINQNTRKLILESEDFRFLVVRAKDVPVYVENGIADLGVAGDDVLLEVNPDVYKPLDLKIGYCNIVVAGKPEDRDYYFSNPSSFDVATKYPKITAKFFSDKGINVRIFELYGSVELAPLVGLAKYIVDIVETGTTLRENGLVVIDTIRPSTAKLIVNRGSYKLKSDKILSLLRKVEEFIK
ncbi:MAG: ATP phosphoribosyltransferase [Sulfurihydrogenibium sp.]